VVKIHEVVTIIIRSDTPDSEKVPRLHDVFVVSNISQPFLWYNVELELIGKKSEGHCDICHKKLKFIMTNTCSYYTCGNCLSRPVIDFKWNPKKSIECPLCHYTMKVKKSDRKAGRMKCNSCGIEIELGENFLAE